MSTNRKFNSVSPYMTTNLVTDVELEPYFMNNDLYGNLKKNLEDKLLNKSYKNYGYIINVIKINDFENNIIPIEVLTGTAIYKLYFTCRLCTPMTDTVIICKIDKITETFITGKNGPITFFVNRDKINDKYFFFEKNNNLKYKNSNNVVQDVNVGQLVRILIGCIEYRPSDIIIAGYLLSISTKDDISIYNNDILEFKTNKNM